MLRRRWANRYWIFVFTIIASSTISPVIHATPSPNCFDVEPPDYNPGYFQISAATSGPKAVTATQLLDILDLWSNGRWNVSPNINREIFGDFFSIVIHPNDGVSRALLEQDIAKALSIPQVTAECVSILTGTGAITISN